AGVARLGGTGVVTTVHGHHVAVVALLVAFDEAIAADGGTTGRRLTSAHPTVLLGTGVIAAVHGRRVAVIALLEPGDTTVTACGCHRGGRQGVGVEVAGTARRDHFDEVGTRWHIETLHRLGSHGVGATDRHTRRVVESEVAIAGGPAIEGHVEEHLGREGDGVKLGFTVDNGHQAHRIRDGVASGEAANASRHHDHHL